MANRNFNRKQALEQEIKELYADGLFAFSAATATLDLTADIALTSVAKGPARNTTTLTTQVATAASNAGDALLVTFSGTAAAITATITPHTGDVATATFDLTADVVVTTEAVGITRNTNTITLQVVAAAANPTNTVLVAVSGTTAATVITVTPNDGTNNAATPVNLTTAQLAAYINADGVSGTYTGVVVTASGTPSLLAGLAATGGGATALADAGEGDGIVATFAGGSIAVSCTTANFVELINTGAIAGKTVTVTDGSTLRALQTATGGGSTPMVDAGEGDAVVATFGSGDISVTWNSRVGIASMTRTAQGTFRVTLQDQFFGFKSLKGVFLKSTGEDLRVQVKAVSLSAKTYDIFTLTGATATDPSENLPFYLKFELKNSTLSY